MTINILIADDSALSQALLRQILEIDNDMRVIGIANDGEQAIRLTKELHPNIITMDIHMPKLNGFEATQRIMEECPTPIVVISSHTNNAESDITFNALKAGALAVFEKPTDILAPGFQVKQRILRNTVRALSEVHVISRSQLKKKNTVLQKPKCLANMPSILALGTSTGGPEALHVILSRLPADFPVPIVIVQHITKGFLSGMIDWLQHKSKLAIKIVTQENENLIAGHVYFAPDGYHLQVKSTESGPVAMLNDEPPVNHLKPAVDLLFQSLAKNYPGKAVAGLLTGMGRDGAQGLLEMCQAGCHTFIQDEKSSVVFGMPGAAQKLGATDECIDLLKIPEYLNELLCQTKNKEKKDD